MLLLTAKLIKIKSEAVSCTSDGGGGGGGGGAGGEGWGGGFRMRAASAVYYTGGEICVSWLRNSHLVVLTQYIFILLTIQTLLKRTHT